jgi:lipoprotein-anchoring transpeptidase ErfK/SrfK
MKIRSTHARAAGLAVMAALAVGACSKSPTIEVGSQAGNQGTDQSAQAQDQSQSSGDQLAPGASVNVQSKVSQLQVHADADASSKVVTTLKDKTKLGSKTTLLVVDAKDDWLKVQLPTRPNGSTGWVQAKDVQTRTNDMVVNVDLGAKTVTVQKGDQVVAQTPVAIGTDDTPTPKGTFYISDFVKTDPKGDYGPFAFGLSGHSDKLTEFAGGDGQIGVHGTNDPSSIGKAASHGCVRLPNDVITKLATMVPLGTPVIIS